MSAATRPVARLGELVAAQHERWSFADLDAARGDEAAGADASRGEAARADEAAGADQAARAELVAHLERHRGELGPWLAAPPGGAGSPDAGTDSDDVDWEHTPRRFLRARLVRWLERRNQFLMLDAAAHAELEAIAGALLADLGRALAGGSTRHARESGADQALDVRVRAAFEAYRAALAAFVHARLGATAHEAVSGEYSPALQLSALGLAAAPSDGVVDGDGDDASARFQVSDSVRAPILDVGCGRGAELVRALRREGYEAYGLDRDAPDDVGFTGDWLGFAYGADRWGTVLSHLGFSLHFLHQHLANRPEAFTYARVYMAILRSLRVGGRFAYVPGLPFLETMLPPASWRCERVALPEALARTLGRPLPGGSDVAAHLADLGLSHATHVWRVG